jgi:hypothetical protein
MSSNENNVSFKTFVQEESYCENCRKEGYILERNHKQSNVKLSSHLRNSYLARFIKIRTKN